MATINGMDDIPVRYERDRPLTFRDALAMSSLLVFLLVPMGITFYTVCEWFGVANDFSLREQLHGSTAWLFGAISILCTCALAVAGRYLWLAAMAPILSKTEIGPLVAYGLPRRISRLDQTIIHRLYKVQRPEREARSRPAKEDTYVCRLHGIAYGAGALLAFGLSFLPLMRGDARLHGLAIVFSVIALSCFGMEFRARKRKK